MEALRLSLRKGLLQEIRRSDVESDLLQFLRQLGNRLPIKEMLARKLAEHFVEKWTFAKTSRLRELIDRRPEQMDAILSSITLEDARLLWNVISKLPPEKRRRLKPVNEQERRKNKGRAKNRYDRGRKYRPTGVGIIEREFGEPMKLLDPSRRWPPWGPCLDTLFIGGTVKMWDDVYCLESLFGMDRHKFPKNLPGTRRGRERFYNLDAVMECMSRVLADERPTHRWLLKPTKRNIVLTGIMSRAQQVGSPEVAASVAKILIRHLT